MLSIELFVIVQKKGFLLNEFYEVAPVAVAGYFFGGVSLYTHFSGG